MLCLPPGVHSLRVARGKKVGEAEAGAGPEGVAARGDPAFLTPYPVPRNTSSSCRASSIPWAASPRGELALQGLGPVLWEGAPAGGTHTLQVDGETEAQGGRMGLCGGSEQSPGMLLSCYYLGESLCVSSVES